jgi:hypothetical protein
MLTRRRAIAWLPMLGAALALPAAAQVQVEGQTFDGSARVAGAELRLNGVGLRAVAWVKGYAAGLYLPRKAATAAEVLAQDGPKRLQLRLLQEVPAVEFVKAFDKGMRRNTAADALPALAARMQRFEALVASLGVVRKGDVIDLDFDPAAGLAFAHNGRVLGAPIEGADFYAALLRIFIGPRPADRELKVGLLGGPVS